MGHNYRAQRVGIEQVSFWLPPTRVDNLESASVHDFGKDFVESKLGITHRAVLDAELSVSDMAAKAVSELLDEVATGGDEIGLLILVTQTGDFAIPHTSAQLQAVCGISESCLVFDISLGCSGYVVGLEVAIALMERLGMSKGLLVTADAYSRIVDPSDRSTAPIFGDAASATLLSTKPKWFVGQSDFGSRGSDFNQLILRGSGSASHARQPLFMDGRGILGFTRSVIPSSVRKTASLNKLLPSEVNKYIFHQANAYVLEVLQNKLELTAGQMVYSLSDIGNTTSSSIPIAFRREILDRETSDQNVLLSGFGVGLSWASTMLLRASE